MAMLRAALGAGVDINARGVFNRTALHLAIWNGQPEITDYLLAKGADPNRADLDGWNALHCAAARGDGQSVEKLLRRGADASIPDLNGRRALDIAQPGAYLTILAHISRKHARTVKTARRRKTPAP